ncbi:MAG TPA: ATP-binding protein, partial [Pirellula sp.]|nr:ATP-binding protein [Pirellula sp.]
MITRFHVENYKALREVSLELTPVHALIGPNDSGKTSILFALAALSRSTDHELVNSFLGTWEGRDLVWHGDTDGVVRFHAELVDGGRHFEYFLACRFANVGRDVRIEREMISLAAQIEIGNQNNAESTVRQIATRNKQATNDVNAACQLVHQALSGVQYYRWNPRMLALPVAPDSSRHFRMNSDGFGLALFLDDVLGHDRKCFAQLEERFTSIFPEIESIQLKRQRAFRSPPDDLEQATRLEQADGKGIYFQLRETKQSVPAAQASDGVLLVLAYLAVLYWPEPPRLLLVEEPENGVHPKRLKDVLQVLRELIKAQSKTQLVFTTHSPYVLSLLEPEEVTLCTKSEGRTNVKRMADSEIVQQQQSLFTLG